MGMYGLEAARFLSRDARVVRGIKQVVTVARPSAGAEWSQTVPGGEQWRVLCGRWTLATSAAAPTRLIQVLIVVDGQEVYRAVDHDAVVASVTRIDNLMASDSPYFGAQASQINYLAMPIMFMPQGSTIGTTTLGLDVADQYSTVNLYVERVYLPDQKLDEIAELEQQAYFAAMRKAGLTQGA